MSNKRTFIALPLPDPIKAILQNIQEVLAPVSQGIKWVDPELTHITLKFLGDTPERMLEDVREEFIRIVTPTKAFELQLKTVGQFPREGDPRVLWVGLQQIPGMVYRLSDELNAGYISLGFDDTGKRFSPHITLGRVKQKLHDDFVQHFNDININPEIFTVDRIIWYESRHKNGRLNYLPLEEYILK